MGDGTTYGQREAVRMPLWLSIAGSAVLYVTVSLLVGGWGDWKPAVIAVLTGLGPLLFGTEVARGGAWSPLSVWDAARQARGDPPALPPPTEAGRLDVQPPPPGVAVD